MNGNEKAGQKVGGGCHSKLNGNDHGNDPKNDGLISSTNH